jgi:hypothetical protein
VSAEGSKPGRRRRGRRPHGQTILRGRHEHLFRGRRHKHVTRRTYQEDFARAAGKAGLPPEFIPQALRHCYASVALARGVPITDVSRWLGHNSIEVTHQVYGPVVHAHANALLTGTGATRAILADLRDPGKIIAEAGQFLDLAKAGMYTAVAAKNYARSGATPRTGLRPPSPEPRT